MALALIITAVFVVIEIAAGLASNSLALLTDAAHNFTDVIALGLSAFALRLAARPASPQRTFGYHRAGILIALLNSTTLVLIALGIFYEAFQRLIHPPQVDALMLAGVGGIALLVNAGTAWLTYQGSDTDLNVRSAFIHLMGDVLSTLGAALAGLLMAFTGALWLDPAVSALIGVLIVYNAWQIIHEAVDILMENTPRDLNMPALIAALEGVPGVRDVHDLHVWSINQQMRALSAHLLIEDMPVSAGAAIQQAANDLLMRHYQIGHATLQLECVGCEPDRLFFGGIRGERRGHRDTEEDGHSH
jgi:cobalt-zinc-cadmium efflux system protein